MPNVIGQSFESASSALQSFGFAVARDDVESEKPDGVVVAQSPDGGTLQLPGTKITLSVSKGPMTLVTVPDVTGHTEADASMKLQDNSFNVDVLTEDVADPGQDGVVLSQNPSGGTKAKSGLTVTIVVGK